MGEEETAEEKALRKENDRWKDYGGALLIAIPILLGGLALSQQKTLQSTVSAVAGFVAIVLVLLWYGRDKNSAVLTPGNRYPTFLFYASFSFGVQIAFLAFAIISKSG